MIILNKQNQASIKDLLGGCDFFNSYLYLLPVEGALVGGFCFEETKSGVYIHKYIHPLFNRQYEFNLNFSESIPYPKGFINKDNAKNSNVVDQIISIITPDVDEVKRKSNMNYLNDYIEHNKALLNNEWIHKDYALNLILLDKLDESVYHLDKILSLNLPINRKQIIDDCAVVKQTILEGKDPKLLLNDWVREMKDRLCQSN
ncbi:hypothetical protein [Aliamphritea spongicola]|uniref:hypothetical protein n=1 Tax=Aliamphritea spongicola TaxID=707589 RepID=UPI00196B12EE|nr:hypothetical protein [Aliamphritea spongicola]MBN3561208.1 hypothetical protein [Aliamphritea spongicola]